MGSDASAVVETTSLVFTGRYDMLRDCTEKEGRLISHAVCTTVHKFLMLCYCSYVTSHLSSKRSNHRLPSIGQRSIFRH